MTPYLELRDELLLHGTSTLCEASGLSSALDYNIRPIWPSATIVGAAFPLRCAPGDNLAIHLATAQAGSGEVLVVDGHGYIAGYWGEILTVAARSRDVAGLVIDGGVRDVSALERRKFPVFARGIAMRAAVKLHAPSVGAPIVIAGVTIMRGDLIVADADGVVCIPKAEVERTLAAARERSDKEVAIMRRLQAGETTVQILGLKGGR
jgi:4-hydroxy-4-methyl-2-oxoglutarate aldolase